ncbi:initiation SPT3 homolog isoform X1 [Argonauta hians]
MENKGAVPQGLNVPMSPTVGSKMTPAQWFTIEIQQMMHGFGDCRKPLQESAALLQEIVHSQMLFLLYQASEVAAKRNGRFISLEDFLFLLRKDKVKLHRLLRYMKMKDLKSASLRGTGFDDDEQSDALLEKPGQPSQKKRLKMCYDFIASFDQTGELLVLFEDDSMDEIKLDRMVRAEMLSRQMSPQQYREFCESRQVNFSRKYKSQRFKDWLMSGVCIEPKPNPLALEMFSYLAYETIAQLMDLAIIVQREAMGNSGEPIGRHIGGLTTSSSSSSSSSDSCNYYESFPENNNNNNNSGSQLPGQAGLKNVPANQLELQTYQAITPADIREALRRYSEMPGPFSGAVKRVAGSSPRNVLLCL